MAERTVEVGGEVLKVGDTVIVREWRGSEEREIVRIGVKNLYLKKHGNEEEAFNIATRKSLTNRTGTGAAFRTRTEVARMEKRDGLILRLHELGLQPVEGSRKPLDRYDDEALERVIAVLSEYENSEK